MRTRDIEMTLRIPVTNVDENGVPYDMKAWRDSMLACEGKPIIKRDCDGTETIIGVVTKAEEDNFPYMKVHGRLFYGGTDECGDFKDGVFVTSGITSIGIVK